MVKICEVHVRVLTNAILFVGVDSGPRGASRAPRPRPVGSAGGGVAVVQSGSVSSPLSVVVSCFVLLPFAFIAMMWKRLPPRLLAKALCPFGPDEVAKVGSCTIAASKVPAATAHGPKRRIDCLIGV